MLQGTFAWAGEGAAGLWLPRNDRLLLLTSLCGVGVVPQHKDALL